jgi:hypothetical protein
LTPKCLAHSRSVEIRLSPDFPLRI